MKYKLLFFITIAAAQFVYWLRIFLNLTRENNLTDPVCLSLFSVFMGVAFISFFIAVYMAIREVRTASSIDALEKDKQLREQQNESLKQIHDENAAYKEEILHQFSRLQDSLETKNQEIICKNYHILNRRLDSFSSHNYCSHSLINAILHDKLQKAEKQQIQVAYQIQMPAEVNIPLPSLANIFFNLLDNAIEACTGLPEGPAFIRLDVSYRGNMMSIHMVNSKNPETVFEHRTTKADTLSHGFGLSIIEDIVHTYNGTCEWLDHQSEFESILMLDVQGGESHVS